MDKLDKLLKDLVEKLQKAHGKRLRAVILYGSAASGDAQARYSDLNVLCALAGIEPADLAAAEPVIKWWREKGNPAPLLLSVEEIRTSTDCFPIEFRDIVERRRVLYGEDVVAGLEIEEVFYRAQVEHDLRAKLIRLRQKAAGVLSSEELLLRLMCDSVATFCVLARHGLRLAGFEAPWAKRAVVARMKEAFLIEGRAFDMLLDLREGSKPARGTSAVDLFRSYLEEIGALVLAVDRLER